ncbi:hypothetical protein VTN49DRAFT_494 [Thermomyces lanuginosus]|uniref:uncharacterized protein n=1 Tax=Thermomyces lanuginosus TaxID=5541 RepID=UPI00374288BA
MRASLACIIAALCAATANPVPGAKKIENTCSPGSSVHCCETVSDTSDSNVLNILQKAGIDKSVADAKGQVGLTCTPITTALINAANGNTCQGAVTACCEDVEQIGLVNVNLGCAVIPVNV